MLNNCNMKVHGIASLWSVQMETSEMQKLSFTGRWVQQGWARLLGHRRTAPRTVLCPEILPRDWAVLQGSATPHIVVSKTWNMQCICHHRRRRRLFAPFAPLAHILHAPGTTSLVNKLISAQHFSLLCAVFFNAWELISQDIPTFCMHWESDFL